MLYNGRRRVGRESMCDRVREDESGMFTISYCVARFSAATKSPC
jgi:hypothetical protein